MVRAVTSILVAMAIGLAGAAGATEVPEPVSPGRSGAMALVADVCPTFSWGSAAAARAYELVVYRVAEEARPVSAAAVLHTRIAGTASSWTPALGECFEPGGGYAWAVRAVGAVAPGEWSEARLFEVAAAPSARQVEQALAVLERYLASVGEGERVAVTELAADEPAEVDPEPAALEAPGPAAPGDGVAIAETTITIGGQEVVTAATDRDTLAGMSCADGELAKWSAGLAAWQCGEAGGSVEYSAGHQLVLTDHTFHVEEAGLNADLLDGQEATAFMLAGTDLWVDEGGDTMTGTLSLDPGSGVIALETAADVELGGRVLKGGAPFLSSDADRNTGLGLGALGVVTDGTLNTAVGDGALASNTTGGSNTALGVDALSSNEGDDPATTEFTEGSANTAVGVGALRDNTRGSSNTAVGDQALLSNTTGSSNTAVGRSTLSANITGTHNTATGAGSLRSNTTGINNTADGAGSLFSNIGGSHNTAVGADALYYNTSGYGNTAAGASALVSNLTGTLNTGIGYDALVYNTEGGSNTAVGQKALRANVTGSENTAVGRQALRDSTGSGNIALGADAGVKLTTGDDNIHVGNVGASSETGTIKIGTEGTHSAAFIAGIRDTAVAGSPVVVAPSGQLGVATVATGDADTLDGLDSSQFLRSDEPDTMTGTLTLAPTTGNALETTAAIDLGGDLLMRGVRVFHSPAIGSLGVGHSALGTVASDHDDNTAVGWWALLSNTTGEYNTSVGAYSMVANTSGRKNTATGAFALRNNVSAHSNSAFGYSALSNNDYGTMNSGFGASALSSNTRGSHNTGVGALSLFSEYGGYGNTAVGSLAMHDLLGDDPLTPTVAEGEKNTAIGFRALFSNSRGWKNTASGSLALHSNTTGYRNTAAGDVALFSNNTGHDNVATGVEALYSNTTGSHNTASGARALAANEIGSFNTAVGSDTLSDGAGSGGNVAVGWRALQYAERWNNTALGTQALRYSTGWDNIAIGNAAGLNLTTEASSDNILIGNRGVDGDANTIRIGDGGHTRSFIGGIHGTDVVSGTPVVVTAQGQLGVGEVNADLLDGQEASDFAAAVHGHNGGDIVSGVVAEPRIHPDITRNDEILEILSTQDGAGSGLDADLLDGHHKDDFAPVLHNMILVSKPPHGHFHSIQEALDAIGTALPAASLENRYLIKVGPGKYNEQVRMKPWVDIEGSGEGVTTVSYHGGESYLPSEDPAGTVFGASHAELRFIRVENDGGNQYPYAIAIYAELASMKLTHVTAVASDGLTAAWGLLNWESDTQVTHFTAHAEGGASSYGIRIDYSNAQLDHVTASAKGTNLVRGVMAGLGQSRLTNVVAVAEGVPGASTLGIWNWGKTSMANVVTQAYGGDENVGLFVRSTSMMTDVTASAHGGLVSKGVLVVSSEPTLVNLTAQASGAGENYGVFLDGSEFDGVHAARIEHSRLGGDTGRALYVSNAWSAAYVAYTEVEGAAGGVTANLTCLGAYDWNFEALGPDCGAPIL